MRNPWQDVQLYDGITPLISWCEKKPKTRSTQISRGCGLLPSTPDVDGEESTSYGEMVISYSGYAGVSGNPGKEFITIQGKTTTTLTMRAFAFEAGEAGVSYEWGRVQTGCCMGVVGCGGSLTTHVDENAYVTIGSIPAGKKDVTVRLTSAADIDIQLYDIGLNDTAYPSGQAIIAYVDCGSLTQGQVCQQSGCGTLSLGEVCNAGPLGNNEGTEESASYLERTYTYSGYYGDGNKYGNEWMQISGELNTELLMKAFGYAAGDFTVDYTYFEVVPAAERPTRPSVFWAVSDNNKRQHKVEGVYDTSLTDSNLVLRRGTSLQFTVYVPSQTEATPASVLCHIEAEVEGKDGLTAVQPFPPSTLSYYT